MARTLRVSMLTLLAGLVLAQPAYAQDDYRDTAREGVAAFNDEDHETAIARFEEARAIRATPRIHRLLGRAQLAAGQSVEAARSFHRALATQDPDFELSDSMRTEITSELLPRALQGTAQIQLSGLPADAEVRVDSEVAERFEDVLLLEPGAHTITAPGYTPEENAVDAAAGVTEALSFTEETSADPPQVLPPVAEPSGDDDGLLVPGLTLLVGGLVVAGAGGALLGIGWDAASRVQGTDFYPDVAADDELARWMTPAGIAALAVGGAMAAVGVVLLVLPSGSADTPVALRLGPGQLALSGSFR